MTVPNIIFANQNIKMACHWILYVKLSQKKNCAQNAEIQRQTVSQFGYDALIL